MTNEVATISQVALNIEKLGIVGILALLAIVFIYLYVKQARDNAEILRDIAKNVQETLENQRDLAKKLQEKQSQLLDIIIKRESRFRGENDTN